jgi:hypothetical protein
MAALTPRHGRELLSLRGRTDDRGFAGYSSRSMSGAISSGAAFGA